MNAITICYNYAKYLDITLSFNRSFFDRYIIVTKRQDAETIKVASKYKCEIIKEYFTGFPKGHLINVGLDKANLKGWITHLDADIILPKQYTEAFNSKLEDDCIYGCAGRIHLDNKQLQYFLQTKNLPKNYRVDFGGNLVGYFQLWNLENRQYYYCSSNNAAVDDILFRDSFLERQRRYIKIPVLHIGQPYIHHDGIKNGSSVKSG